MNPETHGQTIDMTLMMIRKKCSNFLRHS